MRRSLFVLSLFATVFGFVIPVADSRAETPQTCPRCETDFAIYNPRYEDDGVWEEEVTALEQMFKTFKWSSRAVDHLEINSGILRKEKDKRFRALIAPGGWSWYRESVVSPAGEQHIREFVKDGGHYVGFCAGAYWAAARLVWAMEASGPGQQYSTPADYNGVFPYELKLYPADAKGPLGWMPWRNGGNVNFSLAEINLKIPALKKIGMPRETRFLYGGGPFFPDAEKIAGLEVWARAKPETPNQSPAAGAGQATIIRFPLGKGSVTLFSYHPDVLIKHQADGISLSQFFKEDDIRWERGGQTFEEINLHSWNIVHAALQLAAGEEVTGVKKLP